MTPPPRCAPFERLVAGVVELAPADPRRSRTEREERAVSDQPGVQRYPHVFEPIRVGPLELPNRTYFSPHGIPIEAPTPGVEAHRVPAVEMAHYLAERAAGGAALIFHSTQLAPWARQFNLMTSPGLREGIPSYRRVADLTHEAGGKIM